MAESDSAGVFTLRMVRTHNPEVAGSNPAPATNVMSQDIGNCRTCNCGSGGGHFRGGLVGPLGAPVGW